MLRQTGDMPWDGAFLFGEESLFAARQALDSLHRATPDTFNSLFLLARRARLQPFVAEPLQRLKLIYQDGNGFRSRVRIWPLDRYYFASDPATSTLSDRVYPVYQDQGGFFARRLAVDSWDSVLDIGTGSGVLAIQASRSARSVTGIDINPRAVGCARFNAALNGASNVNFAVCDLLDFAPSARYDLILCNPPFTAVPEQDAWFVHGSAGYDGLDVVRRFLEYLPDLAKPRGRIQLLLNSLGTEDEIQVLGLVQRAFPNAGIDLHHLFDPSSIAIDSYAKRFADSPAYGEWRCWLSDQGLTHVYRVLVTVDLASPGHFAEHASLGFEFTVVEPFESPPIPVVAGKRSGGWKEMLLRYGSRTIGEDGDGR